MAELAGTLLMKDVLCQVKDMWENHRGAYPSFLISMFGPRDWRRVLPCIVTRLMRLSAFVAETGMFYCAMVSPGNTVVQECSWYLGGREGIKS